DYDTNIQYHSGKANVVADALSKKLGMIAGIKVEKEIIRDLEWLDIELYVRGQHGYWASLRDTRLCVPNDASLREALLTEAHSFPFSVHSGSTKMYHDLKQHFWWSGMKRDVATFVSRCLICQQRRHDAIWVVVDRLTKSAHFLPIRKDYSVSKLAETFQQEIVRLHGTPSAIVSDRDPCFTSRFWKVLQKAWGTRLKFSTAFHPRTDDQTERTIQTLEDMLRSCALEWTGNWDDYICLVEFAYNNSWHASIKCAPFEMLYGRKYRDLICWDQVGERVIEGPEMIEVTNEKVAVTKEKLKEARTHASVSRASLPFEILDRVGEKPVVEMSHALTYGILKFTCRLLNVVAAIVILASRQVIECGCYRIGSLMVEIVWGACGVGGTGGRLVAFSSSPAIEYMRKEKVYNRAILALLTQSFSTGFETTCESLTE
nr:putative reverse transcriptase domain-containing protein [Tanacetum cinerariifolium]